ncbi:SDR family NAD(P)-dependent oxidoreductase [Aquihabitans sp. G128]|nr:SDR family NAD(P)-dependent oxidoreductase [Aquihabitans sp. G128]
MILDKFLVTDQVAIVTGAGRGIGAATAVALAEAGADVLLAARTEAQLLEVAAQVEATGRRAHVVAADLSDLDTVAGLAATAVEAFGRLDIVVDNLGGSMPRPFEHTSPRFLAEAFSFNVVTAHALNRAAVPLMLETGGGSIVGISSVMGRVTGRGFLAYGTAKAALAHYTRLAARDLSPRIRVNAIAVGSVATSALRGRARRRRHAHDHGGGDAAQAHRRRRRHRRHRPVPRVAGRFVPDGQGRGGRRRPRAAQPGLRPARPVKPLGGAPRTRTAVRTGVRIVWHECSTIAP